MKRPIASTLVLAVVLMVAACGEPAPPTAEAPNATSWVMPPEVDAVSSAGQEIVISGLTSPLGRVVVSASGEQAYAVGADPQGRFELRVPRPARDTLFQLEARRGESGFPAPYRLLIGRDAGGPIALLALGAPTRRLDPGRGLDAVDSDGRAAFLSGRAEPGASVVVSGSTDRTVIAGPDGRWHMAGAGDGTSGLTVAGTRYAPLPVGGDQSGVLERAGAGWRIAWTGPGGGRQTTWFPDQPSP